jgi:hypothetical protein
MQVSPLQNAGPNLNIKLANNYLKYLAKLKYFGRRVANQN